MMAHLETLHECAGDDREDFEIRSSIANFRGSFVINHLADSPTAPIPGERKAKIMGWIVPFGENWNSVGIWKSSNYLTSPQAIMH